jgi:hypothetical protein
MVTFSGFLILLFCVLVVYGLFRQRRINYAAGAWFTKRCPFCRSLIDMRARVCQCCHRDVPPQQWVWERPAASRSIDHIEPATKPNVPAFDFSFLKPKSK